MSEEVTKNECPGWVHFVFAMLHIVAFFCLCAGLFVTIPLHILVANNWK